MKEYEVEGRPMKSIIKLTSVEKKTLTKIINKLLKNWLLSWLKRNNSTCEQNL